MLDGDFPRSLRELLAAFGTDDRCRAYLIRQKCPEGFVCPRCGHRKAWHVHSRDIWVCAACQRRASLIAGSCPFSTRAAIVG